MELRYDMSFYVQALDHFLASGECDERNDEPLYAYILSLMNDPYIKMKVLTDKVCASVFYDTTLYFVRSNMEKNKFNMQRSMSEREGMRYALEWSIQKKKDGWQALVNTIGEQYAQYGFDTDFYLMEFGDRDKYTDDGEWEKMVRDWEEAYYCKMDESRHKFVDMRSETEKRRLKDFIEEIPKYLKENRVTEDEFMQAWGMMGGLWNVSEFERIRKIVGLQAVFPEIVKVVNKMGRIADDQGKQRIYASVGDVYQMEHSAKSDILGVTVGDDLNSMMPQELVNCADPDLENLFMYRYLTHKLQIFRYKSELMKPSRHLDAKHASRKGPMIICLDTSGSMTGKPERIAHSLLIKALRTADSQKRKCFLIAFSVSVKPIDVQRERSNLLGILSGVSSGDTSATMMLQTMFDLLESSRDYVNADVLWVTDFRIPMASEQLMRRMAEFQKQNTRFYGLQIGVADNVWSPYFDDIFQVGYLLSRKY